MSQKKHTCRVKGCPGLPLTTPHSCKQYAVRSYWDDTDEADADVVTVASGKPEDAAAKWVENKIACDEFDGNDVYWTVQVLIHGAGWQSHHVFAERGFSCTAQKV